MSTLIYAWNGVTDKSYRQKEIAQEVANRWGELSRLY